jgi:TPP-dependent pyruvate/acetoin dehydrogenase alpha subunit
MIDKKKDTIATKILNIRKFEMLLDVLFEKGKIHGTYHRCIGQESIAVGITENLNFKKDYIVSNHRNHGHYLAFSSDYMGLLKEIMGNEAGISKGLGGSQVIVSNNFYSNGIIGSTVPVAAGVSFSLKVEKKNGVCVCFIGDGAMGQGIIYETLNMCSIFKLPILFILEKNNISQSTKISDITSGSFKKRFESFAIKTHYMDSKNVFNIINKSKKIIETIKKKSEPQAIIFETERMCAHSKGDDYTKKHLGNHDPVKYLKKTIKNFELLNNLSEKFINGISRNIIK